MKAENPFKEKYLIFKAKNKDPESFSQLYNLYVDKIYRFVFFKVKTQEDAQDISSEVFLKAWQYISDNNEVKNLNALLYRIARNLVIDYYRKSSRQDIPIDQQIMEQQEMKMDGIKEVDIRIETEKIEQKLHQLKDDYREIVILRYIEGFSIKEIAEIVEKKPGNVRIILHRALNTLKELMEEEQNK